MNKKLTIEFDFKFDMIFADPPYFLSNGGITMHSGKFVWAAICWVGARETILRVEQSTT